MEYFFELIEGPNCDNITMNISILTLKGQIYMEWLLSKSSVCVWGQGFFRIGVNEQPGGRGHVDYGARFDLASTCNHFIIMLLLSFLY